MREPSDRRRLSGLIFAGGRATRLGGRNKALLEVGGQTIIARILSAPDSPLAMLVKAASRETTLGAKPEGETTVVDKATDKITAAGGTVTTL